MPTRGDTKDLMRRGFARLPVSQRLAVLHALGRYAPWEDKFDFTPPTLRLGEEVGPPDFVGIGVQKGGTTWWYELLISHPGVSARPDIHKERHFFDRFGAKPFGAADIEDYHGWFPRQTGTITGEWTPDYFTMPWVPPLLHAAAPDARLLVLLRDPVERFRSGLAHQARVGLACDGATIADAVNRGFYDRALATWSEQFGAERILVLQHERCVADRDGQLHATHEFLGLDDHEVPALHLAGRSETVSTCSSLPSELRRRMVELYAPDVESLASRLPDLDLTVWPNFAFLVR